MQAHTGIQTSYMSTKQRDINVVMRAILVDWLVEVAEEYKLHAETLFVCVRARVAWHLACAAQYHEYYVIHRRWR